LGSRNQTEGVSVGTGADLFLLGSGIYSFLDITLYTQSILKKCKTVFYLHDLPSLDQYLRKITANPINLVPLYYLDGRDRTEIYEDIVDHVIRHAVKKRPTSLLLHGNPVVFSTITQRLLEEAPRHSLAIEIVPAVSSLDRIFVDLRLDIAERGLQVVEASRAVDIPIPVANSIDLLMLQIGALNNSYATRNQHASLEDAVQLKDYLSNYYPPDHLTYIVESTVEIGFETVITRTRLADMEQSASAMTYTASLFVPAVGALIVPYAC
jgi:uncharacterized protein YabN with tetrapyrrole methylase and pyrophosphatase domain